MVEQNIIIGLNTKYPLDGKLTLPENPSGPVPAVVFVHGSGSSNMDEKIMKLTPFKDLAQGLASYGIASVRYDKRSYAHGFKMLRDKNTVVTVKEETIEDAILAAEYLRGDDRIDASNIFILGHSMGGMLAPRIDAEGGDFKGYIIMAGTPYRLEEVMIRQTEESYGEMKGLLKLLANRQMAKITKLFENLYEMSDEEAKKKKMGGGVTLYYFKEMGEHPSTEYLLANEKPVLIMQGGKDFQVRAEVDFAAYKELLKNRANVTYRLYPDLNHGFVPSIYGTIMKMKKEYGVEQHIGDQVIYDIASWVKSKTAE